MKPIVHIIGAGLAGLSCAVHARELGMTVKLYESTPKAGGRIRRVNEHDNGTHLLVKGYQHTFEYLDKIGTSSSLKPYKTASYKMCEGPLSWEVPGHHIFGHIARGVVPGVNVLNLMGKTAKRRLWEPLYLAVYNTPMATIPGKLVRDTFLEILKQGPSAMEPYFVENTLEEAFVVPAFKQFDIEYGQSLRKITTNQLEFKDKTININDGDKVVLALPSQAYEHIAHPFSIPTFEYNAITNVHFYPTLKQCEQFFGLVNTLSQWVYTKDNHICVTISNYKNDRDDLADHIWKEIRFHLDMAESALPEHKVVTEKFATPVQDKHFVENRLDTQTNLHNVFLAGDWVNTGLPCTIEGAIKSGKNAALAAFS